MSDDPGDWLRQTLVEDELFSVSTDVPGGPFTHAVGYLEEVAHERDDLVRRSAAALAGLAGVASVNTDEGDDVVLVEAPSLSASDLSSWLREWWSRAIEVPPPWEEPLRQLAGALTGVLRPHGFEDGLVEPSGVTFRSRTDPDVVHTLELRRFSSRRDDQLWVTADAEVRVDRPGRPGGPVVYSIRESELRPPPDRGWLVPRDVAALAAFIAGRHLPALARMRSAADLLASLDAGAGGGRATRGMRALLHADRGEADVAGRLLQEEFDAGPPRARPFVAELCAALGLASLETGRDPSLSRADEAFLEHWSREEQLRVERLRRLAGDELDGSVESLGAVWRWLPGALTGARTSGDPGEGAIATAYHGVVSGATTYHRYVAGSDGSPALHWLAELVVTYLASVLRSREPAIRWAIAPDRELVLVGLAYGPVPILRKTWEALAEVLADPDGAAEPEEIDLDDLLSDIAGGDADDELRAAMAHLLGVDHGGNRLASLVEQWLRPQASSVAEQHADALPPVDAEDRLGEERRDADDARLR